jgi:ATP-dependent exoDNAse (exonuclease V) alpha subunit
VAIYHLTVKPVSRAGGRSATAASAYRAAEIVHDHTTGQTFDYTRKRGVEHTEIVLPTEAARRDINWARDREALWNAAEVAENRSNSRVAREYELALPHEMNHGQRVELVQAFSQTLADRYGVAVDFAIHAPHREGDERNVHAHLLSTTRTIEAGGLGKKSEVEWSEGNRQKAGLAPGPEELTAIRAQWKHLVNERLQALGIEARIDHRTLEAQGIEREPTTHLGPAVASMERRGIATEVGKRLELETLAAAQQRLEKAAEFGRLEREGQVVEKSILDLSGDLEGAKRERDLQLLRQTQLAGQGPLSIDELQKQGREKWLAMRAESQAKEKAPEQSAEKGAEKTLEPGQGPALTIDEQRAQAAERWAEYRRTHTLDNARTLEPDQGREKGPEKDLRPSKGLDGPEFE